MALMKHSENIAQESALGRIVPNYSLYGETRPLEDMLHCERIAARCVQNDWVIGPHRHIALHQFICVTEGGGGCVMDGEAMQIEAGSMVNIPNGVIHEFHFRAGTDGYVVTVAVQEMPEVMRMSVANPTRLIRPFVIPMNNRVASLFPAIEAEVASSEVYHTPALRALAMLIAIEAVRQDQRSRESDSGGGTSPPMARFLPLIREHLRDGWTVSEFAAAASVSRVHLNRLCQKAMGCSCRELIENVRFQEACRLLTYSEMPVTKIGFELGFDDPSYFSRAFRRKLGETPSRYRQQRQDRRRPPALDG
jgi:AraC family transcriptional activator of pobA